MKTVLAPRASTILYDILQSRADPRPYLLPANICPIVPITFLKARTPVEFVDISVQTFGMDLETAEQRLRNGDNSYGGLLYAHTYGDPSTPQALFGELKARTPDLLLIDDRCLCPPDLDPKESTAADVTLYSTGYAKIVDIGFGGFGFLHDHVAYRPSSLPFSPPHLAALEADYKACVAARQAYSYKDSDWLETDSHLPDWPKYSDRVRAARAESLARRQSLNAVYNSLLPSELGLPEAFQLWRFSLLVPHKKAVLDAIFAAGLFASSHYASLAGIMGSGRGENAQELAEHVINLFNDHHFTLDMAERTAQIVRRSL